MNQIYPFFFNGQKYQTKYNITISDLIDYFGYNKSLLVVEYNKLICNKKEWQNTSIQKNDTIEIVTIVGGG
jgi:thiamine biosynthesis protein ThiS